MRRIPDGARVLDIGAFDGRLFRELGARLGSGVGIDPNPVREGEFGNYVLTRGFFPDTDIAGPFDAITMLAVIEHVPRDRQADVADACARLLSATGRVIITVPSPVVDTIMHWLVRLRLLRPIEFHQHYGLDPDEVVHVFSQRLRLVVRKRFELGLNNLLVFEP
jgi:SAM-dependent methyltransferase